MRKQVAVVGHSQVPLNIHTFHQPIEYHYFRLPGATISSIYNHEKFTEFWENTYDLTIIVIGGNDIPEEHYHVIKDSYLDLVKRINNKDRYVIPCTLEHRTYTHPFVGNRFIIDTETYGRISRSINQYLVRQFRRHNIEYIDLWRHAFRNARTRDGTHFDVEAANRLRNLITERVHRLFGFEERRWH